MNKGQPTDTKTTASSVSAATSSQMQSTTSSLSKSMKDVNISEPAFSESGTRYRSSPQAEGFVETTTVLEPTVLVEHRERGPVIKEHIHQREREEIQPVIHRERERTEVLQVTKPIVEREVQATVVENKILPAETKPTIVQENRQFERDYNANTHRYQNTVEVAPVQHETIEKAPIIHEHLTRRVIEEVQPVIMKEVTVPTLIKEVQNIYEKIIEAPVLVEGGELPVEERTFGSEHMRASEYYREARPAHYSGEYSSEYSGEYSGGLGSTTSTSTYLHEKPPAGPTNVPQQYAPHRG
jgi:hypothetical protein